MGLAPPAQGQARVRVESGIELLAVGSTPEQWLVGGSRWWRTGARTRIGGLAAAGLAGGSLAGRGELAAHFLLNPNAPRGLGWYGGGGVAGTIGEAEAVRMLVLIGVDQRPGAARGWFAELGLGGGVRLAVGWRWRALGVRVLER
ncbi:MAG: hypothetical protein ABR551_06500 [Gemmatimonadales bacterium]